MSCFFVFICTMSNLIHGEIADYEFDGQILVAHSKNIRRTVALIASNVKLVKQITGNRPVPLLIHLKNSPMPDAETRRFSTEKLPEIYTAMAMVSKPGLAQFIMNLLFKFKKPSIPMKSFSNAIDARNWLKTIK